MVGETIAHYRVLEKLGEGGMGAVFKALDTHLERLVAIQTITRLDKPLFLGMTLSPDGRHLLFTQIDQTGADLMLVDPLPGR